MSEAQDPSFLLVKILEDLDSKQNSVSYQDLCKSLCSRYDLPELAKLRSLLYYTACQDPNFPASLFRDKMRNAAENQQSKKIIAAADIVTIFNLIQMNDGVAKEKLPISQQSKQKESIELDNEVYSGTDLAPHKETQKRDTSRTYSITRSSSCHKDECEGCHTFLPEPNFLLGVKKEGNDRGGSLDRLQALDSYPIGTSEPCEMQSTYFPSQPLSEPESLPPTPNEEPFRLSSSTGQRRNIFKDDFHNLLSISPNATMKKTEGRINPKTTVFFNHSFEMPYSSHYLSTAYSSEDSRRVKHESLDDLQASTYFGPTTGLGSQEHKRILSKPRQPITKPVKSWSLNTEEVPDFERSFFNHRKEESLCYPTKGLAQSGSFVSAPDHHHSYLPDLGIKANAKKFCEPQDVEKQEALRRFRDKNSKPTSCQFSIDKTESVGTQTEQTETKKGKESNVPSTCTRYGEGRARNQSEADSELISDDISDIFRFLDDMSLCGSSGIPQSSCYNSSGSLTQAQRTDHESSPEQGTNKTNTKPTKGPRTETGEEEELKSSVRKLVLRIGEIEKKLESLSGVRDEVSQVLAKLNKLDERMQQPSEKIKAEGDNYSHKIDVITTTRASPNSFQDQNTSHNGKLESKSECCCSDVNNGTTESLRVKALKKNLFTQRSVRSLTEEISISDNKISNSPHDCKPWGFPKQQSVSEEQKKDKGGSNSRDWHRKSKEGERQHEIPHLHRMPKPHKESFMVEQVFSPHPYPASLKSHMKSNPIYTDMRLTEMAEVKRTQPSWTIEEYAHNSGEKGRLTALDLQAQESLNPNNLEFWMEDIYTPGYDSLLKRKEAEFRRTKVCKMAALITAAACTVILVIVVPICTMKS
ncbi:major intrinsically disordered Notch2-binding receptor 1 [Bombina bombina]|uniref:major intrinsically disordered Notch2-binding receptor 1 n=1 Tax=Bombina bombina TaxID=8345 RepID=UPI00235A5EE7|nr:major intrinsically disordered Notch2-binding receptor 1 [Bombina bombina]